jgi:GT2 family glycosyltransferase
MNAPAGPSVSVIVCTRDRADQLLVTLAALLASTLRDFELLIVDQSADDASATVVERYGDARVRYVRDTGRGLSRARNIGVAASAGSIVAFTDDDCEPEADWLSRVAATLEQDWRVGAVFGAVRPASYDAGLGFIDGYIPARRLRVTGRFALRRGQGMGANMAIRRGALTRSGPFDEMLGAGGYFPSFEDWDMAYRILADGWAIVHDPEAVVIHHGFRDWSAGSRLIRNTYTAIAAGYMKHIRARDPVAAALLADSMVTALAYLARRTVTRQRPVGFGRLAAHFTGIRRSFELPVDRKRCLYVAKR